MIPPSSHFSRNPKLKLAVLISGSGRTLVNLASWQKNNPDLVEIVQVIASKAGLAGINRADELGIPVEILPCTNPQDSIKIFDFLGSVNVDLAVLGGWLRLLHIPDSWLRRVINIHPSLIPKYAGQGFYGERVHQAVLKSQDKSSGCTVHFVDNIFDHGPVLLQESVPVEQDDDVASLAARVFEAECRAYPRAIELLATGRISWQDGQPVISEPR